MTREELLNDIHQIKIALMVGNSTGVLTPPQERDLIRELIMLYDTLSTLDSALLAERKAA